MKLTPLFDLLVERCRPFAGEFVILALAPLIGVGPGSGDESVAFEAMEPWVERAFLPLERLIGPLLDLLNDLIPVHLALREQLENDRDNGPLDPFL